ncbi:MAG TPA: acyl carrier protein [Steroidobacteraceae bacterium]|nr:acyl carrier protein [Steroidobacteraceae bacterium]
MSDDVIARVRAFIAENFLMGGDATLAEGDSLMRAHVLDSTGFLELVGFLENAFDIQVEDPEMIPENLDSLRAIAAYVARKRANAGSA